MIERPQLFFCDASSGLLREQLGQAMWIIGDKGKLSSTSKLFLTGVSLQVPPTGSLQESMAVMKRSVGEAGFNSL